MSGKRGAPARISRSGSGSKSLEREADILHALFGITTTQFLRRVAGRTYLLHHGAAGRLDALLGAGNISSQAALERLATGYRRQISRVVYEDGDTLRLRRLRVRERPGMARVPGACYFLSSYDAPFRKVAQLRRALCTAFGAQLRSSDFCGTLQTHGAFLPRHCDHTDVVVLQIFGIRRWRLQRNSNPPRGLRALVRAPSRLRNGWSAAFAPASPIVDLRPGSALYVPRGWWHETRSVGRSFALIMTLAPAKTP
jgi:ribosomal protein L16 Arg81 hydroxylase